MTRKEYWKHVTTKTTKGGYEQYFMNGFPRKYMSWQMSWDYAGFHRLYGHVRIIQDAIERFGVNRALTMENYITYEAVLRKWLVAHPQYQPGGTKENGHG